MDLPTIIVRGEELTLLSEKLVWWNARHTLFVADAHFGKASTFRKSGIPVPAGTTADMLGRLSGAVARHTAKRLVVLGDFVHSSRRNPEGFEKLLLQWRSLHSSLSISLVLGNHDRGQLALMKAMDIDMHTAPMFEPPFACCHQVEESTDTAYYTLAGHVHPAVRCIQSGQKYPCFFFGERHAILPAFGDFTGTKALHFHPADDVYAVADGEVVEIPAALRLSY
jgi:uncharacterized protein